MILSKHCLITVTEYRYLSVTMFDINLTSQIGNHNSGILTN